ncbi:MAG: hypothetical protein K2X11_20240 [Acetobacteraceae bacterium]|nr:hypothetical protein [Acetobacteraceae bacterium]
MPHLVRFMLAHAGIGFALATLFVAAILLANPAGIGALLLREGLFPVALLWFFSGLTFGGAQMGIAVMLLDQRDMDRPVRPSGRPVRALALARAPARRR